MDPGLKSPLRLTSFGTSPTSSERTFWIRSRHVLRVLSQRSWGRWPQPAGLRSEGALKSRVQDPPGGGGLDVPAGVDDDVVAGDVLGAWRYEKADRLTDVFFVDESAHRSLGSKICINVVIRLVELLGLA